MLSEKIIAFCKEKGWWYDDLLPEYAEALKSLDIDLNSDFATFYLHVEDSPTFYSRHQALYQICWFVINTPYDISLSFTHAALELPEEYIPLDSFEAEGGFFYNRKTGEVLEIEVGQKLIDFRNGKLSPQWSNFNAFIEWFFELNA